MIATRFVVLCAALSMIHARELTASEPTTSVSILRKPTLETTVHRGVIDDPDILNIPWQRHGDNCYFRLGRMAEAMEGSPSRRAIRTHLVAEYFARRSETEDESWDVEIQELRAAADREQQRVERHGFEPDEGSIVPEVELLVQEMFDHRAQAEGADAALNEALPEQEAARNELTMALPRAFVTTVPGTRIYCVTPFRYQLLAAFEQLGDQQQWAEVVENTQLPVGDFYFWIVKPDGRSIHSGKTHLGEERVVILPGA